MAKRFFLTTAIDYPNSRPHIGTAFEKIGADVQARYRRMEGYEVFFLMGNDENTIKVARRAQELGEDVQAVTMRVAVPSFRKSTTPATFTKPPTRAGIATAARPSKLTKSLRRASARPTRCQRCVDKKIAGILRCQNSRTSFWPSTRPIPISSNPSRGATR